MEKEKVYREIEKLELPEDKLFVKTIYPSKEVLGTFIDFAKIKEVIILEGVDGIEVQVKIVDIVEIRAILTDINDER